MDEARATYLETKKTHPAGHPERVRAWKKLCTARSKWLGRIRENEEARTNG